jgi:DNA-directed RNA polymerase sigma subunit (sigma70/sigma32)
MNNAARGLWREKKKNLRYLNGLVRESEDGELLDFFDVLEDPKTDNSLDRLYGEEMVKKLRDAMEDLNDQEKMVIGRRYGFNVSRKIYSLNSVAKELGVCNESVRGIHDKAINKLAELIGSNK